MLTRSTSHAANRYRRPLQRRSGKRGGRKEAYSRMHSNIDDDRYVEDDSDWEDVDDSANDESSDDSSGESVARIIVGWDEQTLPSTVAFVTSTNTSKMSG